MRIDEKLLTYINDLEIIDTNEHQSLARQNVAASLTQKVDDGVFDLDRAIEIAKWVFVDNPIKLFDLCIPARAK